MKFKISKLKKVKPTATDPGPKSETKDQLGPAMEYHRHLDDELDSLRDRVLLLGGEAEAALARAM